MGWFRRLISDERAEPERPTFTYGQFCADVEADRCKAEIDTLVDAFLARCRGLGRAGRENLALRKSVHVGHSYVRTSVGIGGAGLGWRHLQPGLFGLCVQNDGYWNFHGYHTWREPPGAPTVELSLWSLARGGGWSAVTQHERYHVAERATGTPQAALAGFQQAIDGWESRPLVRSSRR